MLIPNPHWWPGLDGTLGRDESGRGAGGCSVPQPALECRYHCGSSQIRHAAHSVRPNTWHGVTSCSGFPCFAFASGGGVSELSKLCCFINKNNHYVPLSFPEWAHSSPSYLWLTASTWICAGNLPRTARECCQEMHCWSPQAPADNIIITYPREIELRMVFFSKNLSTFILHGSFACEERRDSAQGYY